MSKRVADQQLSGESSKPRPRVNSSGPRQVFDEIKGKAYDASAYQVDRSVPYEEEFPPSNAVLVPAFVHWNTAAPPGKGPTAPPPPIRQQFLWRWQPGASLALSAQRCLRQLQPHQRCTKHAPQLRGLDLALQSDLCAVLSPGTASCTTSRRQRHAMALRRL